MLDIEVTHEVADAIAEIGRKSDRPLTREACTTPELRLEYIAQWLETGGDKRGNAKKFNMHHYGVYECFTTCCIAGSTYLFFKGPAKYRDVGVDMITEEAMSLLGLSKYDGRSLFAPNGYHNDSITAAHAARCIRKYQREGVVDWEGTR